jgi:HEPN domain-containing protein
MARCWWHLGRVCAAIYPEGLRETLPRLADISSWLRKEREFSFYGDIDFIPTEEYSEDDAKRAILDAEFVVHIASKVIPPRSSSPDSHAGDR